MNTLTQSSVADDLMRRLRTVRPDSRALWGRMNAHQMICHLNDSMRVATGDRQASPASGLVQRTALKWVALYLPVRWPPGIMTRPEIDQLIAGTRPAEFARDVEELVDRLRAFRTPGRRDAPHPIFGVMSERQWMRWAYLHTDHHLRQFGA